MVSIGKVRLCLVTMVIKTAMKAKLTKVTMVNLAYGWVRLSQIMKGKGG